MKPMWQRQVQYPTARRPKHQASEGREAGCRAAASSRNRVVVSSLWLLQSRAWLRLSPTSESSASW